MRSVACASAGWWGCHAERQECRRSRCGKEDDEVSFEHAASQVLEGHAHAAVQGQLHRSSGKTHIIAVAMGIGDIK